MLQPTLEGDSEIIDIHRLVRVTIWGKMDGLLVCRDRFVKIAGVAQTPESTFKGDFNYCCHCRCNKCPSSYGLVHKVGDQAALAAATDPKPCLDS